MQLKAAALGMIEIPTLSQKLWRCQHNPEAVLLIVGTRKQPAVTETHKVSVTFFFTLAGQ